MANEEVNYVVKISSSGTVLSGTNGYTVGSGSYGIAIDGAGNVWVANGDNSVTELSSAGVSLSGTNGYTSGGLNYPYAIAVDSSGNACGGGISKVTP